ncbi:hypothetical protein [Rhizobium laguerreae]|uniref:hypothetical protein n=1 Tax=Rhizobium laguerreae TaxID=1076926 RepID=UPI001C90FD53|nr:hypothetical protein [Rhizobium laguerreae]MBY3434797.1 hypothetical protein [Rhizobium laguerreae]MBY3448940.1 hypothetical protein [Rhizobium laguerreae]MBY3456714.1 hypothetical protein [Rhizobium laguerreae]
MDVQLVTAEVGNRIWFASEKRPYKVRARNARYLICTKPFNPKKTVLYTIIDLDEEVRGPDNLIFGVGYEDEASIAENMRSLAAGEMEVSHRNRIDLDVVRVAA